MRLSHIKLAGFKSFVDPTHIHLPGQITGIVGPNGCGKSNVIDALRWVLGESKASALRGESMQDVIFNGSLRRKAVARASVELVFDNTLGRAAGQWSDYAEISIKRVLLRNGDSSYHINNQKVRRRDITDIFLGTGLGARAYAIVEQGMISRIIEAKPDELRVFLEEAAGVSRYRDRRRETSLRLNDTRDNLLRVDDILQEMDKQLSHLSAQAQVATQYRQLEGQRDTAQHQLWLYRKQEAASLRSGFILSIENARTELELQSAVLRQTESLIETERSAHQGLADAVHAGQGKLFEVNAGISRLEQEIKHAEQQQQRLSQQIQNAERQQQGQQQQIEASQGQLAQWQSKLEEAAARLIEAELLFEQSGEELPRCEEAVRHAQDAYHARQREGLGLGQQLQLAKTQQEHLQRNLMQKESRQAKLLQEKSLLPPPAEAALQQIRETLAELDMVCCEQDEQLRSLQDSLPEQDRARQSLRSKLQQQSLQAAKREARLHALGQMQQDGNLTSWLKAHGLDKLPPLWHSIKIAPEWQTALEAVLRERLYALPVDAKLDAPPARMALFEPGRIPCQTVSSLQPLLSYLQYKDEQAMAAMHEWLAGIYVAPDLESALSMRDQLPDGGYFVTQQGHLTGHCSVFFHAPDSHLSGVLARAQEIEQLEAQSLTDDRDIETVKAALAEVESRCLAIEVEIPKLQAALAASRQRQHAQQMQLLKLNQVDERSRERERQLSQEIEELAGLQQEERALQADAAERIKLLEQSCERFEAQQEESRQLALTQEGRLREVREQVRRAQHELQEAQFSLRTCRDKSADLSCRIAELNEMREQTALQLQQLQSESAASRDETVFEALQLSLQAKVEAERELALARAELESAAGRLLNLEQTRINTEHGLSRLREQLTELSLKEQEARLYFEQWQEKLQGVDESHLALAAVKPAQLQSELARLNRAIEALGAVNLAALDEMRAAVERKAYLDAQAQDLQQAMATLTEAIRHIDRESRDLLMHTFNQVNLQLAELFPVLFAGGEARLVLTGEEILESGVQVMAQPPGKKNSSIHLLSGGEKALTAIALIFSLFRLNPAPFCLLDEVDAPLDDTNTERLCALVRKMAQHTQFVFISHNKIAMEMAMQLIGVTMQEKGVSKVVSVDVEMALRMRDE